MRDDDLSGTAVVGQLHGGGVWLKALGAGAHQLEVEAGSQADPRVRDVVAIPHIHHLQPAGRVCGKNLASVVTLSNSTAYLSRGCSLPVHKCSSSVLYERSVRRRPSQYNCRVLRYRKLVFREGCWVRKSKMRVSLPALEDCLQACKRCEQQKPSHRALAQYKLFNQLAALRKMQQDNSPAEDLCLELRACALDTTIAPSTLVMIVRLPLSEDCLVVDVRLAFVPSIWPTTSVMVSASAMIWQG